MRQRAGEWGAPAPHQNVNEAIWAQATPGSLQTKRMCSKPTPHGAKSISTEPWLPVHRRGRESTPAAADLPAATEA